MKLHSLHEIESTSGTFKLLDVGNHLQHEIGTEVVLIPQPTRGDPNDPLNWPRPKRLAAYWSCLILAGLANFCVTGLGPAFGPIAEQFHVDDFQLTWLISVTSLGMALGVFTIAPLALKFGKRVVWLGCSIAFFACNLWAAASPTYTSLLLARFFAIWAGGASEPLAMDTIKDLFFLHERGFQSGVLGMVFVLFSTLAPLISGFLVQAKGWRWYHWLVSIISGIDMLLIFFLLPETNYQRDLHYALDDARAYNVDDIDEKPTHAMPTTDPKTSSPIHIEQATSSDIFIAKPYLQQLKPWSSVSSKISAYWPLVRPWITMIFPAVSWATLAFSAHVACFIVIVTVTPIFLRLPPYSFTTSQQGLTFVGPVIGSLLGGILCGKLNDIVIRALSKRNDGIFEPEMRLPVTCVPMVATIVGLLMFGIGIENGDHWIVPVIGSTLVSAGLSAIPSTLQPYLLDSYFAASLDVFTFFHGGKNFVVFAFAFGISPWIRLDGIAVVFGILAALVAIFDLGWLLFYKFGKKWRQNDARKKIFPF